MVFGDLESKFGINEKSFLLLNIILVSSCIPLQVAPKIDNYKLQQAKKFTENYSSRKRLFFRDTKEDGEWREYLSFRFPSHTEVLMLSLCRL